MSQQAQVKNHPPSPLRMKFHAPSAFLALTLTLGLASCSSVQTTMKKVTKPIKAMAKVNTARIKNLRLPGTRNDIPPVVAVRKGDLRKVETGQEKIVAWNRARKEAALGSISLPEDFDPSELPVGGQLPVSGILPPLTSGDASSTQITSPDGELPADVAALPDLTELPAEEDGE